MLKGKKGDASIIIFMLIIIFFIAVSFLVVNYVGAELIEIMDTTILNSTEAAPAISDAMETITTSTIDNGVLIIFVFLIIGIIISSFMIRVHVVWLFLYIIFLAVGIFLAVFLGNAYQDISERTIFAAAVANMPITIWIMQNIVRIMLGVGALSMVVVFSKVFGRGGYVERV